MFFVPLCFFHSFIDCSSSRCQPRAKDIFDDVPRAVPSPRPRGNVQFDDDEPTEFFPSPSPTPHPCTPPLRYDAPVSIPLSPSRTPTQADRGRTGLIHPRRHPPTIAQAHMHVFRLSDTSPPPHPRPWRSCDSPQGKCCLHVVDIMGRPPPHLVDIH